MASAFVYRQGSAGHYLKDAPGTRALIQQITEATKNSAQGSYMANRQSSRPSPVRFRTDFGETPRRYRGAVIATHVNPAAQRRIEAALAGAAGRGTNFVAGERKAATSAE